MLKNSGRAIHICDHLTYRVEVAQDFVKCHWCVALGMSRMQLGENDKPMDPRGCIRLHAVLVEASDRRYRTARALATSPVETSAGQTI